MITCQFVYDPREFDTKKTQSQNLEIRWWQISLNSAERRSAHQTSGPTAGSPRVVYCALLCMGEVGKMDLGCHGSAIMHEKLEKQPRGWGFRGDSMESTTSSRSTGYCYSLATPRYNGQPTAGGNVPGQASWWPSPGSSPRQLPGAAETLPLFCAISSEI